MLAIVDRLTPQPKGPPSSSYATSPRGLAAYASVLERSGHPVRRLRTRIADERAARPTRRWSCSTRDVMEPEEARAIGEWVRAGGRLVAGGAATRRWLDEVLDDAAAPGSADGARRRRTLVPVGETAGVGEVRSPTAAAGTSSAARCRVIGPPDAPLLVTARSGEGERRAAGRRLAAAERGARRGRRRGARASRWRAAQARTVAFLETVHGYGVARGFGGLPDAASSGRCSGSR